MPNSSKPSIFGLQTRLPAQDRHSPWQLLRLFHLYRLALAGMLLLLFLFERGPAFLGIYNTELFTATAVAYLGLTLAAALLPLQRWLSEANQAYLAVFVDIVAITLLMHASGGVRTGLGMLLGVSIAAGSLIIRGPTALLFAALAALAILTEQVYSHFYESFSTSAFTQAGLLGVTFFAMALLADELSRRLLETEQLASRRELDLANLAQLNDYIIQHMQTGILIVDPDQRIRLHNEAACSLLNTPDLANGQRLDDINRELQEQLHRWRETPGSERRSFRPAPGGRDLQINLIPLGQETHIGTLVFLEDSALVAEQAQQMKLASLGRLTASIAHEIRNPLGAISHAGQLLQEAQALDDTERRLTEIIRTNSQRVNEIVEDILQLSRRGSAQPKLLELQPWLEQFAEDFRYSHSLASEQLRIEVDPGDIQIRVDPGQLRQILTNLCENAACNFTDAQAKLRLLITAGVTPQSGGPFLAVIDNGPGIAPEAAAHIFEPFYTTRSDGTGLGLYIAKELGESNRARLEYLPVSPTGCCFRLSFPNLRNKVFNP